MFTQRKEHKANNVKTFKRKFWTKSPGKHEMGSLLYVYYFYSLVYKVAERIICPYKNM